MSSYNIGPDQPLLYSATAGGGGSFSQVGLCMSGRALSENLAQEQRAVGDYKPVIIREGLHRGYGTADMYVQDASWLDNVIRNPATGRLTQFAMRVGSPDEYDTHQYCKLDMLRLECAAGGELRATADWKALVVDPTNSAVSNPAFSTNKTQMWYNAALSGLGNGRNSSALEVASMTVTINNNTDWLPVLDTSLNPERAAKYIREGQQVVAANLRFLIVPDIDLSADAISEIATVTVVFSNTDVTFTLTLEGLHMVQQERPLNVDTLVQYGVNYLVKDASIT